MGSRSGSTNMPEPGSAAGSGGPFGDFCTRHYRAASLVVMGLAAFNLCFRLDREFLSEWDGSLYAISAWEALHHGHWIGTTFLGRLDYYNTKPPLLVWLLALTFKVAGVSLLSLRGVSVMSAWGTIAILQRWTRARFGAAVALVTSLVLSTTFGFIYVHAGRDVSTDALFTLVCLLTVIAASVAGERPVMRAWLGLLLAAAFLLRGMGVLLPLALAAAVHAVRRRPPVLAWPWTIAGGVALLAPIVAWSVARYQVDGWLFFERMVRYDFVARSVDTLEGHQGGVFYYADILQKHHYEWLIVSAAAFMRRPPRWRLARHRIVAWWRTDDPRLVLLVWAVVSIGIPTLMTTKTPWYLNTFYPVFAVTVALTVCPWLDRAAGASPRAWWRSVAVGGCLLAWLLSEAKLLHYSYAYRDISHSEQAMLLEERAQLRGRRIHLVQETRAAYFVAEAIVGARPALAPDIATAVSSSAPGDFVLARQPCVDVTLLPVREANGHALCRRLALVEAPITRR